MESGSKSPFPSGMLSPFQCVRAWKFYMDRMKADGASASVSGGTRYKMLCQRVGYWNSWLSRPGEAGDPVPRQRDNLFSLTICLLSWCLLSSLHLTARVFQAICISVFVETLDFLRRKSDKSHRGRGKGKNLGLSKTW